MTVMEFSHIKKQPFMQDKILNLQGRQSIMFPIKTLFLHHTATRMNSRPGIHGMSVRSIFSGPLNDPRN